MKFSLKIKEPIINNIKEKKTKSDAEAKRIKCKNVNLIESELAASIVAFKEKRLTLKKDFAPDCIIFINAIQKPNFETILTNQYTASELLKHFFNGKYSKRIKK